MHKVNFDIKPGERVGVVGRTGAGKSSLALSLLRFTLKSSGNITINGVDIDKVNLETLRQRVTIIPQDPILFSGTIRSNLDPFGAIDDSDLLRALEGSGLNNSEGVATPPEAESNDVARTRRITLDTTVTAGGDNLSQGQRQLLAFARALVRRSKLVILDEVCTRQQYIESHLLTSSFRQQVQQTIKRI